MSEKCIYKATNLIDGKIYIGQTNNLERRIREHRSHVVKDGGPFHDAIRQFGFHNFRFDILEWCNSENSDERERFYIAKFRDSLGLEKVYNYCDGGLGGQTHDVSGANNPCFGKKYTQEEKDARSKKLKGRKIPENVCQKISKALKGRPKTREQIMKRGHPMSVINVDTGEILHFISKGEMERKLNCAAITLMKGRITHNGYKLYED